MGKLYKVLSCFYKADFRLSVAIFTMVLVWSSCPYVVALSLIVNLAMIIANYQFLIYIFKQFEMQNKLDLQG
jgi:hypothetical protein